jgi:hypothetical protein
MAAIMFLALVNPATVAAAPPGNNSDLLWGYEGATMNSRVLSYRIGPPVVAGPECVPAPGMRSGRGISYDPLSGNLWITHINSITGNGDGLIHQIVPPNVDTACPEVKTIPFGDGPGGAIQDDIGALDADTDSKHLWAAGHRPVGGMSFLYLVNRNTGEILQSCSIPFQGGGPGANDMGNDTLATIHDPRQPGSAKLLLTDAGGEETTSNMLFLIEQSACHGGQEVTPVAEFEKNNPMSGIDFEWPGLLNTDSDELFNDGAPPFATSTSHGQWGNTDAMEDITLCGFRATFGGRGNDMCRHP